MRAKSTWWFVLVLGLVLGCSSQQAPAQDDERDKPVPRAKKKKSAEKGAASRPKSKQKDARKYLAKIRDKYLKKDEKPFQLDNVVLFVPEVSLFGGSGGDKAKLINLSRGSATIEIPFHRIMKIKTLKHNEEKLHIEVTLRKLPKQRNQPKPLTGIVKSSLLLEGTYADNGLKTKVKLRETTEIVIEEQKKKE